MNDLNNIIKEVFERVDDNLKEVKQDYPDIEIKAELYIKQIKPLENIDVTLTIEPSDLALYKIPENLQGGQIWHVNYEQRDDVIKISPNGKGFFAIGQDALWDLSAVSEWYKEIKL